MPPTRQPFSQIDAFADRPFAGNPAAVCILPSARDAGWMQLVAREMNLAETAFVVPRPDGYDLRWFTPGVEVELCGHATLASAHALWEEGHLAPGVTARFHTRSGVLTADQRDGRIWLDFPATPAVEGEAPPDLVQGIGVPLRWCGRTRFDYLVELEDEADVRALTPDLGRLAQLGTRGVIVTAAADPGAYHFVSRFFAPAAGIPEDPVTGSAHCALGPYWGAKLGRAALVGFQASARGGEVETRLAGDRVLLGGRAVTVIRGEIVA